MGKVVLYGTGRGASVAHRFLVADSDHEVVGFTVDAKFRMGENFRGLPVVPFENVQDAFPAASHSMLILLGYQEMNGLRARKYHEAKAKGYTLESYVASDIFRVEPIKVGENCFILDKQSISLDVSIGNNVVMWSSNHIGDLTVISDHAWLTSHVTLAAGVTIGESAFVGIGATISNKVTVGRGSFVGANAMVSENVADGGVTIDGKSLLANTPARTFMRVMMAKGKL